MKKKILTTLVAGTVLATGAYAFHEKGERGPQCRKYAEDYAKKNGEYPSFNDRGFFRGGHGFGGRGFKRGGHGFGGNGMIMPYMYELDLSDMQRQEVFKIMQDIREANYKSVTKYFTDTKFNKTEYEKAMKERYDSRFKNQADMIEKVYNVLDINQKAKLKALLNQSDKDRDVFFKRASNSWK